MADYSHTNPPPIDLKKLAAEAAQEAYSPRTKKCWPWTHQWAMWRKDGLCHRIVCVQRDRPQIKFFY